MFFLVFEKFQCLQLPTAKDLSPSILRFHMAHVMCPKRWLKVSELLGLFTNEVADERFQKSHFYTPRIST